MARSADAAFFAAVFLGEAVRALAGRPTSRAAVRSLVTARIAGMPDSAAAAIDGYVCFSAQDWWYFSHGHSDIQLMTSIAREREVLFVNSLGMRMPRPGATTTPWSRIARKLSSASRGLCTPLPEVPGFHVLTPLFLPVYGDGLLARLNQTMVRSQVRRAMRKVGIRSPAVIVTLPTAWPVARGLLRTRTIAYRSDRYSALPEADTSLVAGLERDLLNAADAALFASGELMAQERSLTAEPVLLPHGIDLQRFAPADTMELHPLLAEIAHPRVGYVGMIDAYTVDVGLLEAVARDLPDAQLVLAGQVEVDISELLALPNVHHLGVLDFEEVPRVLAGLDVALMPWQNNEWIRHCNPIKLKEYLAVGLAVVSTDFPEARRFADVMELAEDPAQFSHLVSRVLAGDEPATPQQRRDSVGAQTWDIQARRVMSLAEQPLGPEQAKLGGPTCAAS